MLLQTGRKTAGNTTGQRAVHWDADIQKLLIAVPPVCLYGVGEAHLAVRQGPLSKEGAAQGHGLVRQPLDHLGLGVQPGEALLQQAAHQGDVGAAAHHQHRQVRRLPDLRLPEGLFRQVHRPADHRLDAGLILLPVEGHPLDAPAGEARDDGGELRGGGEGLLGLPGGLAQGPEVIAAGGKALHIDAAGVPAQLVQDQLLHLFIQEIAGLPAAVVAQLAEGVRLPGVVLHALQHADIKGTGAHVEG